MKKMKSLMQSVHKPVESKKKEKNKNDKNDKSVKSSAEGKGKKKNSKEKKPEAKIAAPPPMSVMGAPGTNTTADKLGMSMKNPRRTKPSLPTQPSKTVVMTVKDPPKPMTRSDREFEPANSCLAPMSKLAPATSPSPAQSPHNTPTTTSSSPANSPHPQSSPADSPAPLTPTSVFDQPEQDLPMEPDPAAILDPERETRSVTGRDPDAMTPDQVRNLKEFIRQYEQVGVKGLMDEFTTIKGYNLEPFEIGGHNLNPTKNRYQDIFCIEPTRIRLHDGKEGEYIHANYVRGPPFMNQFITTQGPLEETVNDYWRLVVQENVGYIFMLCSIVELGKKKCEQYIPETEGETRTYCDIKVTLEVKQEDSHFINSKLIVEAPGKQKRYLYHHFWKNWPDRGVPITALAGLRLLRHARMTTCATIVHCSAGVGRTGTLVALEWLLQRILTSPPPYDMRDMLRAVRNQRAHAIQTAPQYAYVCFAVFRLFTLIEPTNTACFHKFSADMQIHAGVVLPPPPVAGQGSRGRGAQQPVPGTEPNAPTPV